MSNSTPPSITVEPDSTLAPYEQIRAQYAHAINSGRLTPETKLPTVRRLAEDLGLAVNTVARAYRELESEGLIETRGRAGTVVASRADAAARQEITAHAATYAKHARRLGITLDEAVQALREATKA